MNAVRHLVRPRCPVAALQFLVLLAVAWRTQGTLDTALEDTEAWRTQGTVASVAWHIQGTVAWHHTPHTDSLRMLRMDLLHTLHRGLAQLHHSPRFKTRVHGY